MGEMKGIDSTYGLEVVDVRKEGLWSEVNALVDNVCSWRIGNRVCFEDKQSRPYGRVNPLRTFSTHFG